MKKHLPQLLLCLLFLSTADLLSGQTETELKNLFYHLPLNSSSAIICSNLKVNKKFIDKTENPLDSTTYCGTTNDKGSLNFDPDSTLIELKRELEIYKPKWRLGTKMMPLTILNIQHYGTSYNHLKEEYERCTAVVKQLSKDSNVIGMGSNYGLKGEGVKYKLKGKTLMYVEILFVSLPQNNYALYLSYKNYSN